MSNSADNTMDDLTGDQMLEALMALANPHRLRIIAALVDGREYVSKLAREIGMSRPLLHMHLQRLQAAGLVTGTLELSDDGKAMKYYEVAPFVLHLTPETVAAAAASLAAPAPATTTDTEQAPPATNTSDPTGDQE